MRCGCSAFNIEIFVVGYAIIINANRRKNTGLASLKF